MNQSRKWILDQFAQFLLVHVPSSTFYTYLLLHMALVLFNAFAVLDGFVVDEILSLNKSQDSVLVVLSCPQLPHSLIIFPHITTR